MKILGIKDIAYNKQQEYKAEYITWSLNNPGQLMMGALSKETGAILAGYCENIEEINLLLKIEYRRWKDSIDKKQINGHKWVIQGLEEVKEEYLKHNPNVQN